MKKYSGLTLVELMITLVIAGVLVAAGVPGLRSLVVRRQVQVATDRLQSDFRYARAEAFKRGHSVTICRSDDGIGCHATEGSWHVGWIVFDDIDGDRVVDTGEAVLRVQGGFWALVAITVNGGAVSPTKYEFKPNGVAPGSSSNITITGDPQMKKGGSRFICVSNQARLDLQPDGTTAC